MIHSVYGTLCDPSAVATTTAYIDPSLLSKDTTFTKIFVGGLPYHTTDKTLREYFEVFGEIEEAVVITDRQTGKSKGYGFVTMKDKIGAERACKDPNPIIDGRKANVNLAYLGAKPRANLQLAGLQPLALQTGLPLMPASRLGLPQVVYPTASPLLTSQILVPQMSPLSATAAGAAAAQQLLDYSGAYNPYVTAAYDMQAATAAAYAPHYAAAGLIPGYAGATYATAAQGGLPAAQVTYQAGPQPPDGQRVQ